MFRFLCCFLMACAMPIQAARKITVLEIPAEGDLESARAVSFMARPVSETPVTEYGGGFAVDDEPASGCAGDMCRQLLCYTGMAVAGVGGLAWSKCSSEDTQGVSCVVPQVLCISGAVVFITAFLWPSTNPVNVPSPAPSPVEEPVESDVSRVVVL